MAPLQKISPVWADRPCVVMASGPSLTAEVAKQVRMARWLEGWSVITVNDAYKRLPHADLLYACDWGWWKHHQGVPDFHGERWTCHSTSMEVCDDKSQVMGTYDLKYIEAVNKRGFSSDPSHIHYGIPQPSSGFQAVNLALLFGSPLIVLVGFDGHAQNGKHFFGDHPPHLDRGTDQGYREFSKAFVANDRIVNATPGSTIGVYARVDLETVLRDGSPHRHRPVADAGADQRCQA